MRIALVSEHASPLYRDLGGVDAGGQNVFVAELAAALARRGVEVTVHTRRDDPALPDRVPMGAGVVVEHVAAGPAAPLSKDALLPHMAEFSRTLLRSWRRRPPAVVHAHFWMSGMASLRAAGRLGLPVVQTFHGLGAVKRRHQGAADTSPRERLGEEGRIIAGADRIIATCSDEVFELLRLGADRRRITVIPCGVDLGQFRPDGRTARRSVRRRVVAVSRLVARKGIGNLVTALADVPDCELVVAGGPAADALDADSEYRRFRHLAFDAGVTDRVRFLGAVARTDMPALMRSADIVACTPWYEPFGMVALEAMACGVGVVASAVGGLVDTVVDGVTGLHVPARQPRAAAGALRELLERPRMLAAMGVAGADRARQRYGWDRIAAATAAVYTRLADGADNVASR